MSLTIDDIERLLAAAATRPVGVPEPAEPAEPPEPPEPAEVGDDDDTNSTETIGRLSSREMPFTHLDHALQTAAVLRQDVPDDVELAVAGLVHDIGHLLPGVGDAEHADAGAEAIRDALGELVAGPVGLHVEAKRYLVARQSAYGEILAADSVASLALQGGPMTADEQQAFERLPHAQRALHLRRADERGKVDGLVVAGLGEWMEVLRALYRAPSN